VTLLRPTLAWRFSADSVSTGMETR
jgi:hypothetical protein